MEKHPLCYYQRVSVYYYNFLFCLILASFVDIDEQNPLKSLVLPVI